MSGRSETSSFAFVPDGFQGGTFTELTSGLVILKGIVGWRTTGHWVLPHANGRAPAGLFPMRSVHPLRFLARVPQYNLLCPDRWRWSPGCVVPVDVMIAKPVHSVG